MDIRLSFQGIRCFPGRQEAAIRPLTLLVGENSSGKSTFLAICRVASAMFSTGDRAVSIPASFNEPPFMLGAYDQIASSVGRNGQAKSLLIGVANSIHSEVELVPHRGQPSLKVHRLLLDGTSVETVLGGEKAVIRVSEPGKQPTTSELPSAQLGSDVGQPWMFYGVHKGLSSGFCRALQNKAESLGTILGYALAFAPIRTSPLRTYDPRVSMRDPAGSHIPMLLAQYSSQDKDGWSKLQKGINDFGANSGLFERVDVRRLGDGEGDPFQLLVGVGGKTFNLADVGYGVSQVLPLVTDALRCRAGLLLIQQPEVHLHPSAQAALGSFFASQASKKLRFVIETHSDYIVDRVRMEVRAGRLKPHDVSLLYFERHERASRIHSLDLDREGNILNPPPGYRQFFLDEERDLLGV